MASSSRYVSGPVTLAVAQMASVPGNRDANLARSVHWLESAKNAGAQLAVLPELVQSGYAIDGDQARGLAERPPQGAAMAAWQEAARRWDLFIVAGLVEEGESGPYNSAVLIGPEGWIGSYRKAHLFYRERAVFVAGDSGFPVFDTVLGKIGLAICYDLRFPEVFDAMVRAGAELIAVPTAWISLGERRWDERGMPMQGYCAMALASMYRVFVACADTVGVCAPDNVFLGSSLIAGPDGWPRAGPAPVGSEALLVSTVDLKEARNKRISPMNDVMADRRRELYRRPGGGKQRES